MSRSFYTRDRPIHAAAARPLQRIGILAHGFSDWGGGIDFLRIVVSSLRHASPTIELHALVPTRGPLVHLRNLRNWARTRLTKGAVEARRPDPTHLESVLTESGVTLHPVDLGPIALARTSQRLQLDVVLPAISPQLASPVPWVGYIFDFQHRHLPQFFTEQERTKRDRAFEKMLSSAKTVVVNARDVVNDIERYYPNRRARVFSMPFSPAPASDAFSVNVDDARQRHGVHGRYFIVCNQFWKHKDHGTAFKAFAVLAAQYPDLKLVCTGLTSDYRFPRHFSQLMGEAARDGIANRILPLGLIPKPDQLALIRGSVALIQPTLFEGGPGGGAVYDAVALGRRSIVSDIPINTEIEESTVTFFKASNVESLAAQMISGLAAGDEHSIPPDQTVLIARGIERRRACGNLLMQAVEHAIYSESAHQ